MKLLKEDYGQSTQLDDFVYNALYRFSTYYKVTLFHRDSRPQVQERYFAFDDAAKDYYNNLIKDIKEKYDWDDATVTLSEIKVRLDEDEQEEFILDRDNEEDIIEEPIVEPEEEIIEEE